MGWGNAPADNGTTLKVGWGRGCGCGELVRPSPPRRASPRSGVSACPQMPAWGSQCFSLPSSPALSLLLKSRPPWPRPCPLSRLPCLGAGGSGAPGVDPLPGGPGLAPARGTSSPGRLPVDSSPPPTLEPEQGGAGRAGGQEDAVSWRSSLLPCRPPLLLPSLRPPRLLLCWGAAVASQPGLQDGTLCPPAWGLDPLWAAPRAGLTPAQFPPPPWAVGPGGCVHLPREQGGSKRPGAGPGAHAPPLPLLSFLGTPPARSVPLPPEAGCCCRDPRRLVLLFSWPLSGVASGQRPAPGVGTVRAGAQLRLPFPLWDFQAGRQAA